MDQKELWIPSPKEVGYVSTSEDEVSRCLVHIKSLIQSNIFRINNNSGFEWQISKHRYEINSRLAQFGWKIDVEVTGASKDSATTTFIIVPA